MEESEASRGTSSSEEGDRQRTEAHVRHAEHDVLASEQKDYARTGNVSSPFSFQRRMDNAASDALRSEGPGDSVGSSPAINQQQQQVLREVVTKGLDEVGTDDQPRS